MLRRASDVERITARLALKSVRPRELSGLRETLELLPDVVNALPDLSPLLVQMRGDLRSHRPALICFRKQ